MTTPEEVLLDDGKYHLYLDENGVLCCNRHGEPWEAFQPSKLDYLMFMEILALREKVSPAIAHGDLTENEKSLVRQKRTIEAIGSVRNRLNCSLLDAKRFVDVFRDAEGLR